MTARRLLYLTQHNLSAYRWEGGSLSVETEFSPEDANETFARYLADNASSLISLVINLAEEGFHNELIPYLQSRDRKEVLNRRLNQTFLGASLSVAISHGFESGSRKNERVLLTALTGNALIDPWIKALKQSGARLQGIYSLPLLCEKLVQRLGFKIQRGILITVQDNTIRQSFFDQNHLHFSRVAPLAGNSINDVALSIATEANRFQQYLLSQRLINRGNRLSAHIIAHPLIATAIQSAEFSDSIDVSFHDITGIAKKLALKSELTDSRAQLLYLQIAALTPPRQQFAPPALLKPYRLWQTSRGIQIAGGLILLACLLFSAKLALDADSARAKTEQMTREAQAMEQSYRKALDSLPPIPISNDVLRQLTDRVVELKKPQDSPLRAISLLSPTLIQMPEVEIDNIEWLAPGAKTSNDKGGVASAGLESLLIKGNILLGAQSSSRQLVSTFNALTLRLREANPGATLSVLQTPIDLNVSNTLKSADGRSIRRSSRQFVIQIDYPVLP